MIPGSSATGNAPRSSIINVLITIGLLAIVAFLIVINWPDFTSFITTPWTTEWKKQVAPWVGGIAVVLLLIRIGYSQSWSGFGDAENKIAADKEYVPSKKLWDWLQLLIVTAVLTVGGILFSNDQHQKDVSIAQSNHISDLQIAQDNRKQDLQIANNQAMDSVLDKYVDSMSDLLLNHALGKDGPGSVATSRQPELSLAAQAVAEARTLTALQRLESDPVRKTSVMTFLSESNLLPTVPLSHTNLSGIVLNGRNMQHAKMRYVNLTSADLRGANLTGADLSYSSVYSAYLSFADLSHADLSHANLSCRQLPHVSCTPTTLQGASLFAANLSGTRLQALDLRGLNMRAANLNDANVMDADLRSADLRRAHLHRIILKGARLNGAHLEGVDLRDSIGLTANQLQHTYRGKDSVTGKVTRLPRNIPLALATGHP